VKLVKSRLIVGLSSVILFVLSVLITSILSPMSLFALSPEQKRVIDSGAREFNVEVDACSTPGTYAGNVSNSVYVIGDSLTVGMNNGSLGDDSLTNVLTDRGWAPSINAQGCRPLYNAANESGFSGDGSSCPLGTITSAFNEFEKDRSTITTAGTIVIALGTNNYEASEDVFKQKAIEYIGLIREANSSIGGRIFWVNTFTDGGGKEERATSIAEIVLQTGIQLIDYRSAAIADPAKYSYPENDITHNDQNGYINKVTLVADALGTPASTGSLDGSGTAGFNPISLRYPNFPDEAGIIQATKDYILNEFPASPFADNLQYVDQIYSTAKQSDRDINPLLVLSIARQENGFGQANSSATSNNNYFGITQGSGYRSFPTVEAGIDYFVEKVSRHVSNPTGAYEGIENFYEYISVHNVGLIAYPGEYPPEAPGANATPPYLTYDERMNVYTSWDVNRNSHVPGWDPVERPTMYNPGIYYENSINLINTLTGLSLSGDPVRGASTITGCGAGGIIGPGANGWDLPGEGPNPMRYFSQQREASAPEDAAVEGYFGDSPYGDGTIAGCGCGPTTWSMIVSTLTGVEVLPPEVASWANANGFRSSDAACAGSAWWWVGGAAPISQERWGVTARQITINEAPEELRKGNLIITSVGPGSIFLSPGGTGHLLVMRAVTADGRFLFADPSDSISKRNTYPQLSELGSSRTPVDAQTVSTGLKALFVVERTSP
jgi:hypothetical protein